MTMRPLLALALLCAAPRVRAQTPAAAPIQGLGNIAVTSTRIVDLTPEGVTIAVDLSLTPSRTVTVESIRLSGLSVNALPIHADPIVQLLQLPKGKPTPLPQLTVKVLFRDLTTVAPLRQMVDTQIVHVQGQVNATLHASFVEKLALGTAHPVVALPFTQDVPIALPDSPYARQAADTILSLVQAGLDAGLTGASKANLFEPDWIKTLRAQAPNALFRVETIRHCTVILESAPNEALVQVRQRLLEFPGEPRLLALESRIETRIDQISADQARSGILTEANAALKQRAFARAVAILEECKPPILTPEVSQLLEFAREQAAESAQQQQLANAIGDATFLLRENRCEEAVGLLARFESDSDPRVARLLEQANSALVRQQADQAAALQRIQPFATAGCHEQVLALIGALPAASSNSTEIQQLLAASREAWRSECEHLEEIGRAYARLAAGDCELALVDKGQPDATPVLASMRKSLFARRSSTVDTILSAHLERIQSSSGSGQTHDSELTDNQRLIPFASDTIRAQWTQLVAQQEAEKKSKRSFAPNWKRS